jgi:hypothetical protein
MRCLPYDQFVLHLCHNIHYIHHLCSMLLSTPLEFILSPDDVLFVGYFEVIIV